MIRSAFFILLLVLEFLTVTSSVMHPGSDKPQLLYEPNAPDYRSSDIINQSLFDKLAVDPSLSTFMDVLTQVESVLQLVNNSNAEQPFTLFCPVNSAFRNLDGKSQRELETFLRNHLVPSEKLDVHRLQHTQELETMLDNVRIRVKYHLFSRRTELNGQALVDTAHPIEAVNGVAYRIDHILRSVA